MAGVQLISFAPKIYNGSFPKSGSHWLNLITAHLAKPREGGYWLGSHGGNSWKDSPMPVDKVAAGLATIPRGSWMMGHLGYHERFAEAMQKNNVCMLFIYRDPRDVAVSQTYHIERDDGKSFHPGKEAFMQLGSHEDRLLAVIEGMGDFPGVMERWEWYAPWLNVPWVHPVRYEALHADPKTVASGIVDYVLARDLRNEADSSILMMFGANYTDAIDKALELAERTDLSPSFRQGRVGDWRKEFTPEIRQRFKETDKNGWVKRLGYH